MKHLFYLLLASLVWGCQSKPEGLIGQLDTLPDFPSTLVKPRNVFVWKPESFSPDKGPYTVLYMHDGQNVFLPGFAYGGEEWGVDEALSRLMAEGRIPPCIVVGIWNTENRRFEYCPQKPFEAYADSSFAAYVREKYQPKPEADNYLRFIVNELKPHIDAHYPVYTDPEHTFVMGSSMGGLISLYAAMEYPEVFGAAGCLSTHWPLLTNDIDDPAFTYAMAGYLAERIPALPRKPRIYFDYGTETLDSLYEPRQKVIDSLFRALEYGERNWTSRKFEGAAHNEASWRKRLAEPLEYLLSADAF